MAENDQRKKRLASVRRIQEYKKILEHGACAAEESEGHTVDENLQIVKKLLADAALLSNEGQISDRVGQTTEVLMDVQVVKLACDMMTATVQQIDSVKFSDEQYAESIMKMITDDTGVVDWSRMDRFATGLYGSFKYAPAMGDAVIKFEDPDQSQMVAEKKRESRKRATLAVETRPMTLTQEELGTGDTGSTKLTEILRQIRSMYEKNNRQPIPYYQLIIDPKNMMNTFDNAFQLSFLFRDAFIGFVYDDDHMPAIRVTDSKAKPRVENKQFISRLDSQIISDMINKYKIKKPLLNIDRGSNDDLDGTR